MSASVRLNLFQRMMLRWRDLHPYNPVHVVRVPAALDPERLRACIAERLSTLGLTRLSLDRRQSRIRYEGGPATVELVVVAAADGDALAELSRTIEREFNRPFAQGHHENPFRFVAIDAGGAFHLVLAYDHYAASGDSIARLLSALACAYLGAAEQPLPMECQAPTYRSLFLQHPLWVMRAVLGLVRTVAAARRACRVTVTVGEDGHNAFSYLRLQPAQHNALRATAKAWGITPTELLIAGLMRALAPLAGQRRHERRRNELAVAAILNMRTDFGSRDALGPLLAAFRVAHEVPEGMALRQLAQHVHDEATRVKRGHLYLQSILFLGASSLMWPWLSTAKRHGVYAKHFPAWAGVTSLNLNPLWARSGCAATAPLDYLRGVPTGPLCPLVLALTHSHDVLHIGIAWRTAVFSRADVDGVAAALQHDLAELVALSPT